MRVSNLTYFKCSEQSRDRLLYYYELSEPIDQNSEQPSRDRQKFEGTFPKRFRKMLERIIKQGDKSSGAVNTSSNSRLNYNSTEGEAILTNEERLKFEVE